MANTQIQNKIRLTGRIVTEPVYTSYGDEDEGNQSHFVRARMMFDGDGQEKGNQFITVKSFNDVATGWHGEIEKGTIIELLGSLRFEEWNSQGARRSQVVVVAKQITVLSQPETVAEEGVKDAVERTHPQLDEKAQEALRLFESMTEKERENVLAGRGFHRSKAKQTA